MKRPEFASDALCAKNAVVCGDVTVGSGSSIWFHTTIRAEVEPIVIGERTNIQDNCVLHVDGGYPLLIGDRVTVGHGAILHGCTVGDDTLIGMGAILLSGSKVGSGCIIGAGSLVTSGTVIPDGSMAFGNPARVRRPITQAELEGNRESMMDYYEGSRDYETQGLMERRR